MLFDELKPMPPTQFKEVITGPAQRATEAGHTLWVAPDLVDRLLADASDGADTLPILALTLSRLYADYGSTGELRLANYEALGGMRHVVQTEIDAVLATDAAQREARLATLRAAFVPWLATVNPANDQPMRRVARWSDLPEASRPLIDALVALRWTGRRTVTTRRGCSRAAASSTPRRCSTSPTSGNASQVPQPSWRPHGRRRTANWPTRRRSASPNYGWPSSRPSTLRSDRRPQRRTRQRCAGDPMSCGLCLRSPPSSP